MPVQLLPFQKLFDVPDVAHRHRCAISGLAITSIVLICTLFFRLVTSVIGSGAFEPDVNVSVVALSMVANPVSGLLLTCIRAVPLSLFVVILVPVSPVLLMTIL